MAKYTDRHDIADSIYVYKQNNSQRWYARFKLDNTWFSKATKKKDLQEAIVEAVKLQTEFKIMLDNNLPVHTSRKLKKHTFNAVADLAIRRMEDTKTDANKANYQKHIDTLKKYHIPFFAKFTIREINEKLLNDFDLWREKEMKRIPAKDTVKKHNAAMQRVLDEAVIQKYITQTELPELTNTGRNSERRAAFTKSEYNQIINESEKWIKECPRKKSKAIRRMLHYYMQIAALTGMRPGTEIDSLTWGDILQLDKDGELYTTITVRKGKTTKYTGTREVICKDEASKPILDLTAMYMANTEKFNESDKIFDLDVAGISNVYGKNFIRLLNKLNLRKSAHGNRTLYSLRHSYITWELEAGTDLTAIATQCGTSMEMIERHYSHVVPAMFAKQLSGRK